METGETEMKLNSCFQIVEEHQRMSVSHMTAGSILRTNHITSGIERVPPSTAFYFILIKIMEAQKHLWGEEVAQGLGELQVKAAPTLDLSLLTPGCSCLHSFVYLSFEACKRTLRMVKWFCGSKWKPLNLQEESIGKAKRPSSAFLHPVSMQERLHTCYQNNHISTFWMWVS